MRTLIIGFYALFVFSLVNGQSRMQSTLDRLAEDPALSHAGFGACVMDLENGEVLAQHRAGRSLAPASSLKVVTTSVALARLGDDFRFATDLQYEGTIDGEGVLRGNLILKGKGDPTLGAPQWGATDNMAAVLERFRLAVQQAGIRKVAEYIIGDGSAYPSAAAAPSWHWNDLGNYYAAGIWGLNLHDNLYYLRFSGRGRRGAKTEVAEVKPELPGLSFVNEVRVAAPGTGDNAYIYGGPYIYRCYLRGTIPAGRGAFTIKGAIPDPPLFAAQALQRELLRVGISTEREAISRQIYGARGGVDAARQTIYTHYSPELKTIVRRTLDKSVNLYCEGLLRKLGRQEGDGSREAGLRALRDYLKAQQVDLNGVYMEDGSGLSLLNAVTPRFLCEVLREAGADFYELLPVVAGGRRVRAKSGTMKRVRAFAGMVRSRSGRLLCVTVIANNFEGSGSAMRQKLEQWLRSL